MNTSVGHRSKSSGAQALADAVLQLYYNRGEVLDKAVGYHESLENFHRMERLASALDDEERRLRARVEAGYRLTLLGKLDEALALHQAITKELKETHHEIVRNRNEQCLAIVLRLLGRYEESLSAHDRSGDASSADGIKYHTWLNSRGHTLWRMGRHQEAIECFQQVLSWATRDSLIVHQATAHNNLGLVYSDLEMLNQARMHHEEALRLRMIFHDSGAICSSYLNLGNVFVQTGEIERGLELWGQALEISRQLGDAATEAMIENNFGEACYNTGDYNGALAHFEKSLRMKEALNLVSYLDSSLEGLVKTYYELRDHSDNIERCRLFGQRLLALEAARPWKKKAVKELLDKIVEEGHRVR